MKLSPFFIYFVITDGCKLQNSRRFEKISVVNVDTILARRNLIMKVAVSIRNAKQSLCTADKVELHVCSDGER